MGDHGAGPLSRGTAEMRVFFAERAVGWEHRYPDDGPSYAAAVAALALGPGARVLDAGCGTGRALPVLREAVGPAGVVVGVDVTPEMLGEAVRLGRGAGLAALIRADVMRLPLPTASMSAVFAAGLVTHLPDAVAGLAELARVCRSQGRLVLFHPVGRAELARRRGHELDADDPRAPERLPDVLAAAGWDLLEVEDSAERYMALARRAPRSGVGS